MNINDLCINCFQPTGGEEVCMHCGFIQANKPRQTCHLYPHTILRDRYIIGTVINNGGFGVVYKAFDLKLESVVAIKELLPTQNSMVNRLPETVEVIPVNDERRAQFELLKKRFLDEARTLAQFSNCDSIVHVYDFFEANNTAYLVMEYLDGGTLRDYLDSTHNQKMSFNDAMGVIMPVMEALKTVHSKNIIHRDVSPDNIFICSNGKVKLIDFGAARFDETEKETNYSVVMKPGYTPPEQYRTKGKIGQYTDIYAVGAVLYTILSGVMPEESIDRLEKDNLKRLSRMGVDLPPYADKAIMKAMALRETARFKTMNDFILAIKGEKRSDYPEVELKRRKIFRTVSVALILVIMAGSVLAAYMLRESNTLIPTKEATITLWYRDTGDEALNARWEKIAKDYKYYTSQQKKGKAITLEVKGIPEETYDSELDKAIKNGKAPDIFESSAIETKDNTASLDVLYNELDKKDVGGFENSFIKMKELYQKENKIATAVDLPVIYTYTDYNYKKAPNESADLDALINESRNSGKFSYSLTCNPDAVYYSACAYGYTKGGDDKNLMKLYNAAKLVENGSVVEASEVFKREDKNAIYYIGMISEYNDIRKSLRSGAKSFDVQPLTGNGTYDYYIYPEVWSVSKASSDDNRRAAQFLLYYLIGTSDGASEITSVNKNTYYLPMHTETKKAIASEDYLKIYDSKNEKKLFEVKDVKESKAKAKDVAAKARDAKSTEQDIKDVINK